MPTLVELIRNCAGVGVETRDLPTPLGTGSLVLVPVEPLDLGCKEKLRACRFCRKIKPGPRGGGDQVSHLDSDATCTAKLYSVIVYNRALMLKCCTTWV